MPRTPRHDPTRPGIAGLSNEHLEGIRGGRLTIKEVAEALGITKQTLGRKLKKLGVMAVAFMEPKSPISAPASTLETEPLTPDITHAILQGISLDLLVVVRRSLNQMASDPKATLGSTAAKSYAQSLALIRENLAAMQLIPGEGPSRQIPQMIISTLTKAEEAEIREQAEGEVADVSHNDEEFGSLPLTEDCSSGDSESAPRQPVSDALEKATGAISMLPTPLPSPSDLRAWLALVTRQNGARYLRGLAGEFGIMTGPGEPSEPLIEKIVARAYA